MTDELDRADRHDLRELGWRVHRSKSQRPRRFSRGDVLIIGGDESADVIIDDDDPEIVIELPEGS